PATTPTQTLSLHDALPISIAAFRDYKEHNTAANTLAHVLMARTAKQLHRKGKLLLIPNEVDRYRAFLQDDYMKGIRSITSQRERSEEHTSELQSRENLVCR